MAQADTLQYEYRGIAEDCAGNQFIPVRTITSEHTSSMKLLMKFAEVVVQGLEERFVDRKGMALFGVMSPSRIPNPEDDKFYEYGVSEVKELWKAWDEDGEGSGQVHPAILNNDLGVAALLLEWQAYKKYIWEKEWSGGSKKDRRGVHHLVDDSPIPQFVACSVCPD